MLVCVLNIAINVQENERNITRYNPGKYIIIKFHTKTVIWLNEVITSKTHVSNIQNKQKLLTINLDQIRPNLDIFLLLKKIQYFITSRA